MKLLKSPRLRVVLAWTLLCGSVVGWPLSAFTFAKDEPPFILGLSWLAITLTALDFLTTAEVNKDQKDEG